MSDAATKPANSRQKAFLIECSEPSWIDVAHHLREAGLDITYWVAWVPVRDAIAEKFPDVLFHDTIDAKRAFPLPDFADAKTTLFTEACRTIWEREAQTVYEMMIRFDHGRDLIFIEASVHFYELLLYWNTVLDRMRPDVVIFPTPPHVVYDYVVLKLCKAKKIPTLLFEQAWIYPPYSMSMWNFEDGSVELRQRYAELMAGPKPVPLSSRGREILDRLAGNYAEARVPSEVTLAGTAGHDIADEEYWVEQQRFLEANADLEKRWFDKLAQDEALATAGEQQATEGDVTGATEEHSKTEASVHVTDLKPEEAVSAAVGGRRVMAKLAKVLKRSRDVEVSTEVVAPVEPPVEAPPVPEIIPYAKQVNVSAFAKQRGASIAASFEGKMPNKHYLEQRMDQLRLTRERYRDYQARSSKPQEGERYIFLPLMFQPERTSCPQGGIFSNQAVMVNILSNLVPEGTWIYVKEHPTQLHPNMQSTQARSADFYALLAAFKNVRLIDIDIDSFTLIDGCAAIATIGGTAAVEAVARGKPALVFGHAYYNDCAGIYPATSENDLRRALAEIAANPAVNPGDVEAFFHAIETSLFVGNADANLSTYQIGDNAKNIAQEIMRRLSSGAPVQA